MENSIKGPDPLSDAFFQCFRNRKCYGDWAMHS